MKKIIGRLMFMVMGWKFHSNIDMKEYKKAILICAPHTSNWDFYYCLACFWALGVPSRVFMKDSYTKSWYGFVFKAIGAIGVDRGQRNDLINYASNLLSENEEMMIINTPEATRSYAPQWKKGFYHIAKQANVPIILGVADYKNKTATLERVITIGDKTIEQILDEIAPVYKSEMAKYPELYNEKLY